MSIENIIKIGLLKNLTLFKNNCKIRRRLKKPMTQVIDTTKYIEFVRQTTSPASSDFAALLTRLTELEASADADVPRLMTAAFGISAEAGEFTEVIKKIFLQGKPYNEDNVFHLKRELGDICWYIAQACMALDTTFEEVLQLNYEKLSARYPEGTFDIFRSENRVEGDL
jgi:NTP pyrophosphatase (non-canonical NTP hydrolase)